VVIGISVDKLDDQVKFTDKENLNFPLLADVEKSLTKSMGALGKNGFASRYTYVIDKKGTVVKIYKTVKPAEHPEEVLKYIEENVEKK
jgi:peroxiredoxin Q/BCP